MMTCVRRARASTSAFRRISTDSCLAGRSGPPRAGTAATFSAATGTANRGASSPPTPSVSSQEPVLSQAPAPPGKARPGRPAECGPAASGTRTAGPGAGGVVGTWVKPALVLEKWKKRRDHAAAGSPRPASRS